MDTERRSRNRIVLVVVLVLVIEPRHPIEDEDENEDDEEKFARRAKILRDSSTETTSDGDSRRRRLVFRLIFLHGLDLRRRDVRRPGQARLRLVIALFQDGRRGGRKS